MAIPCQIRRNSPAASTSTHQMPEQNSNKDHALVQAYQEALNCFSQTFDHGQDSESSKSSSTSNNFLLPPNFCFTVKRQTISDNKIQRFKNGEEIESHWREMNEEISIQVTGSDPAVTKEGKSKKIKQRIKKYIVGGLLGLVRILI